MINTAIHSMCVHLFMGALFVVCLAAVVKFYIEKKNIGLAESYGRQIDFVVLFSGAAALFLSALSIITGFLIMPIGAMLSSGIIKNKITISLLLFIMMTAFIGIRYFYKEIIHGRKELYLFSSFLPLSAFGLGIVSSSIGGELTNRSSGFEKIMNFFYIETRWTFYLPTTMLVIITIIALASLIFAFMYNKHARE